MGINVDDGFIYFNEMLYRIMRAQFVTGRKLKFNKVMTVRELVTQFQIAEVMLKEKNSTTKITKEAREQAFFDVHKAQPVNLFLTKMFFKSSFTTWRHYMQKLLRLQRWERQVEEEKYQCMLLGKPFVKPEFKEVEVLTIPIEIEYEMELHISGSEDEHDENDTKSRKSQITQLQRLMSEFHTSKKTESPQWFRRKARLRMESSSKKFTLGVQELTDPRITETLLASERSPTKKEKSAMIVHTSEEAKKTRHMKFVNPNSMEYQNVMLEHKINTHEKKKTIIPFANTELKLGDYAG